MFIKMKKENTTIIPALLLLTTIPITNWFLLVLYRFISMPIHELFHLLCVQYFSNGKAKTTISFGFIQGFTYSDYYADLTDKHEIRINAMIGYIGETLFFFATLIFKRIDISLPCFLFWSILFLGSTDFKYILQPKSYVYEPDQTKFSICGNILLLALTTVIGIAIYYLNWNQSICYYLFHITAPCTVYLFVTLMCACYILYSVLSA